MTIDTEHFRTRLLEERERVRHALKRLETDHGGAFEDESDEVGVAFDNHMGDVATDTVNREIDYSLEANAEQHLGEIDAALKRLEEGTYGKCRVGGEEIPAERLEAIPWTAVCINHAERG